MLHPMLIDSHCHLDFPDFADDREAVIARAKARGIGRLITISTRVERFAEISAIAERYPDIFCTIGTFAWGVPVPSDPKHIMYVWVDALTNYITATGYPDKNAPRAKFWPADAHVIGKDITRFHAIYWPAFLMSAKIAVPRQIVVHGFLFNRGEKMSKS